MRPGRQTNLPSHMADLEGLLLEGGIDIRLSDLSPYAAVTIHDGRVELHVSDAFFGESPELQRDLVLHEIAHVVRGDLITAQRVGAFADERKRLAFNVAADALINESLPHIYRSGRFYTYSGLRRDRRDLPDHLPDTMWLYRQLLRDSAANPDADASESLSGGGGGGSGSSAGDSGTSRGASGASASDGSSTDASGADASGSGAGAAGGRDGTPGGDHKSFGNGNGDSRRASGDLLEPTGDADANATGWAATVARLTRAARERGIRLPTGGGTAQYPGDSRGASSAPSTGTRSVTPETVAMGDVQRAIERAIVRVRQSARGGDTVKDARTYRRLRNGLPMYLSRPAVRVAIAVDVSGTMEEYYGRIVYLARRLARDHAVDVLAWSDRCVRMRPPYNEAVTFGGGTLLAPAIREARRLSPDVLVIVTDDDLHDRAAAYHELESLNAVILWVIVPPGPCSSEPRRGTIVRWGAERR